MPKFSQFHNVRTYVVIIVISIIVFRVSTGSPVLSWYSFALITIAARLLLDSLSFTKKVRIDNEKSSYYQAATYSFWGVFIVGTMAYVILLIFNLAHPTWVEGFFSGMAFSLVLFELFALVLAAQYGR